MAVNAECRNIKYWGFLVFTADPQTWSPSLPSITSGCYHTATAIFTTYCNLFSMQDILLCPVHHNIQERDITFPCESDFVELGESNMSLPNILFRNLSVKFSISGNCFCDSETKKKIIMALLD
jgi:hypothetical protein